MPDRTGHDIAITGMACIFPGAANLNEFWRNITAGRDAISEVPPGRWDEVFYDPGSQAVERLYCNRGGFIDEHASFDAVRWGVMPVAAKASEPDQLLMLEVADRALRDAGCGDGDFAREKSGVILGRGGYLNSGMGRLVQKVRVSQELVECLRKLIPSITEAQLAEVQRDYQSKIGHIGPDTVIGLVPNLAASRIANRLDLQGPSYTIDAACASSLIAVDRACEDLVSGRSDLMIAGGVHLTHDVTFWSVFCQLGALSRAGLSRPFDRDADGLLIGEGLGAVVLERLSDAEANGRRVYAVIRGSGVSSDGRDSSLMTPRAEGQMLALKRAWQGLGIDPTDPDALGMIEAHGTGTPAGDEAELETLGQFFGQPRSEASAVLGSVKSMIGHSMPAAGIAGLIKTAMAVHTGTLPPTLHCTTPHPSLERTRFRTISESEPWASNGVPRRAGVNAFGFGGINAHVVLEEHRARKASVAAPPDTDGALLLAAADPAELLSAIDRGRSSGGSGPCRLAVLNPTPTRVAKARALVERGAPFHGRNGIWFAPRGLILDGGKVAFVYPGVDADFRPQVADLCEFFDREVHPELTSSALNFGESKNTGDLERTGVGIILVNQLLTDILGELGLEADFIAGHSIGEWSGMIASGVLGADEVRAFLGSLRPGMLEVPDAGYAAVGCGPERVAELLGEASEVLVSHDNCPHQVILCGEKSALASAVEALKSNGVICQELTFESGFHSPFFSAFVPPLAKSLESIGVRPPDKPLWSTTTCSPYPSDGAAIRELFLEHLVQPVRFRGLIERLHDEGARVFVQVGTGSLTGFVEDTLRGRPHLALAANTPRRGGLDQMRRTIAALWVEGADVDCRRLFDLDEADLSGTEPTGLKLQLGAPLVELDEKPLATAATSPPTIDSDDPVLAEFEATLQALEDSRRSVLESWDANRLTSSRVVKRKINLQTDPSLTDHAFFPQPAGWTPAEDHFPLVPMTMSISMMVDAARELEAANGGRRVVVGVEKVRAWRWMAVEEPIEVSIAAKTTDADRVHVEIDGYIEGTVVLADDYPAPPAREPGDGTADRPVGMSAAEMYRDRWMFHGPAYQAVIDLDGIGDGGMHGRIERLAAEGSLLDGAGQLFGLWISLTVEENRMALPVRLGHARFFGPEPAVGAQFDCAVHIRQTRGRQVIGDIEIASGDQVWARLESWEDRRFDSDAVQWPVIQFPEHNGLSQRRSEIAGGTWVATGYRSSATRDYFARRYLTGPELAHYRGMRPKQQIAWLSSRIAAKDAARYFLWDHGAGPIFPIEVELGAEESGRPTVTAPGGEDLSISLSHKEGAAVAIVARGREVGIDLERVVERDAGFESLTFTERELSLLTEVSAEGSRAEWITRFWTAKEAAAKAAGTGLQGRPKDFEVTSVHGSRMSVGGCTVDTLREDDWVIGWTL